MAELDKGKPVSLEELMPATLAQTDALTKLLIEKGVKRTRSSSKSCWRAGAVSAHFESDNAMNRFRLSYSLPFVELDCHRLFR